MPSLIILGVDPGIVRTGYGVISVGDEDIPSVVTFGHISTNTKNDLAQRLHSLYQQLEIIIHETRPDVLSIESIFYADNVRTAIVMGHARGAAIVAGMNNQTRISEYSPREIKQSVVGNGAASKSQVRYMVARLLNYKEPIQPDDASDALAVALCHWHRLKFKQLQTV